MTDEHLDPTRVQAQARAQGQNDPMNPGLNRGAGDVDSGAFPETADPNGATTALPRDLVSGRFLPGNRESLRHGLLARRRELPGLLAEADRRAAAMLAQSLADDGGEAEMPVRRKSLHELRAKTCGLLLQVGAALQAHGVQDRRGKLRVAWLGQWQTLVQTVVRLDTALGLHRHPKRLTDLDLDAFSEPDPEPTPTDPATGGQHA